MLHNTFSRRSAYGLLAALLWGGLLVPVAARAQGADLQLSIEPAEFVLGATEQATVTIRTDTALQPGQVRLHANAGSLSEPRLQEDGSLQATYSPPEAFYPQVAILAAVALVDGQERIGWMALPLAGQGELSVPGRANSDVSIKVGEKTFGPVQADASGQATIRVEVPPGYTEGVAGAAKVAIPGVPFSRILAVPLREEVEASADAALELRVFVVTPRGKPATQATLKFKAKRGSAGGVKKIAPGVYAAQFRPRKKAVGKQARIVVSMTGSRESVSTVAVKVVQGGGPAQILVTPEPAEIGAGADPGTVRVQVLSAGGQPVALTPTLEASAGMVGALEELGPGQYSAPFTPPDSVETNTEVTLTASAPGPGDTLITGTAVVLIKAGMDLDAQLAVEDGAAGEGTTAGADGAGVAVEQPAGASTPATLQLGLHAAFESNFVALNAPGLALDLTWLGSGVLDGLALRLELGGLYQAGESTLSGPLAGQTVQRQLVALPLALQADYRFKVMDSLALFAGVGGLLGYSLSMVDESQAHAVDLAALGQLGLAWTLGPGDLVVKLRYLYGGLATPYGGLGVLGGYALQLL